MARRRQQRSGWSRPRTIKRLVGLAALALVAFLYQQPLRTYLATRDAVAARSTEVRSLAAQKRLLERRLVLETSDAALVREARRRLGYVRPGERLFIVKGIDRWRRAQHKR